MIRRWLAVAFCMAVPLAAAGAQETAWQKQLTSVLFIEKSCKVAFYSGVVDRVVGGKHVVIAKAHCDDRRAFDVTRNDDSEPFQIKECQPAPVAC